MVADPNARRRQPLPGNLSPAGAWASFKSRTPFDGLNSGEERMIHDVFMAGIYHAATVLHMAGKHVASDGVIELAGAMKEEAVAEIAKVE